MFSQRQRTAYHEAGHVVAALTFGAPIISVTITAYVPHMHRARWRSDNDMALAHMVTLCLSGPAAEVAYVGPINDGSDHVDYEMARHYLSEGGVDPLLIGVVIDRCRDAARRLVSTPWARDKISRIADALLKCGTLMGEQISGL
jgi:hypothetical protein